VSAHKQARVFDLGEDLLGKTLFLFTPRITLL
jgi:hypothetical protein